MRGFLWFLNYYYKGCYLDKVMDEKELNFLGSVLKEFFNFFFIMFDNFCVFSTFLLLKSLF